MLLLISSWFWSSFCPFWTSATKNTATMKWIVSLLFFNIMFVHVCKLTSFYSPNSICLFIAITRCVPDNQRTYALGLQWLFLCVFGSMPGPVLFGAFIDKTCVLWEETCSGKGSCLEYNNELLSYLLVAAGLFFQGKHFWLLKCLSLASHFQ